MDESSNHQSTGSMPYLIGISQILGVAALAVTGTWMSHYRGGFSWSGPLQFNVHPLCMVLGMVFLCGDSLLVYRVFRHETKRATKILHGVLHIMALIISLIGIIAVFQFHKSSSIPDMYSLHSWVGITTFTLYLLQWILGFIMFFVPGVGFAYRTKFKPLHSFFGASLLVAAIASCLLGITEKLLFSIPKDYSKMVPEGILANSLGLLLVAFGAVVVYVLTREEWRRPPLPEEQALSIDFKTLTEGESPTEP
ncbi:transmembrane ascorbate-dependent reductase CYB561 [Spea bombifrons]|uniref:transmembrane ascorbate-dependent reductase CYB561 n=1 Tax=Spea bombifrons TaxID=233779 RepID=UPI002349013A|nr:transmembrane ascorbate-dependent reductase CYB561 [Spea bombifrons]XP_053309982.1 transmembrane ascorbate-dependent reductase CYB561 [Spea bombifrons]